MGHRFYTQQVASIGGCPGYHWWEPKKTARVQKADLVPEWAEKIDGMERLTVKDLQGLGAIDIAKQGTVNVPTGRLRAPYTEAIEKVFLFTPSKSMTVRLMKTVLEVIG